MSRGKHTPGPWKVRENGGLMQSVEAKRDWLVFKCGRDFMAREELEANARLIAAAPELLEALELLIAETDPLRLNSGEPWCRVRAVIAKARGEA